MKQSAPCWISGNYWKIKTVLQQLWINLVEIFGLSLIEPFYVAAGFTLYLNRRTRLEAWDIEIGFCRLARRLADSSATPVLLVAVLCLGLSGQALAVAGETTAQPATSPACQDWAARQTRLEQADSAIKRTLAQVLQADEFPHCEPTSAWRFEWNGRPSEQQRSSPLESSLGLWREALGLLYRSSLAGLRTRYGLPFSPGATEDECLRLIGISLADRPELIHFLTRLTRHWQATAYSHRMPDSLAMQELCEQWPHHFLA